MLYNIVRETHDTNANAIVIDYFVMADSFESAIKKWVEDNPTWHKQSEVRKIVKLCDVVIGA